MGKTFYYSIMSSRVNFCFLAPGQFFNLIQSNQDCLLIINLLRTNPFEDLGIMTINLHSHLKSLTESDPVHIKTPEDFEKFLLEKPSILDKITEFIEDPNLKYLFSEKRKRFYIGIV